MRVSKKRRRDPRTGKIQVSKTYLVYFRPPGSPREIAVNTYCRQKENAERKAREIVKDYEAEYVGDTSRRFKRISESPIREHLDVYLKHKHTELDGNQHWYESKLRINGLLNQTGWELIGEITYENLLEWRSNSTLSANTLNNYISALRVFLRWMVDTGKMKENPAERIKALKRRRDSFRRALTKTERNALLRVSGKRRIVYLTAMYTGLRRKELSKLRWDDIHFRKGENFIKVRASTTKNEKSAQIPIPDQLADELQAFRKRLKRKKETVFNRIIPEVCTLKKDLEKAEIPFTDGLGRRCDFHALRYCYALILVENEVPERVRMELMRHSDLSLTAVIYTTADALPTAKYVKKLEPAEWTEKWTEDDVQQGPNRSILGENAQKNENREKFSFTKSVGNQRFESSKIIKVVPRKGLEPLHLAALDPKSSVSTNSTTWACV